MSSCIGKRITVSIFAEPLAECSNRCCMEKKEEKSTSIMFSRKSLDMRKTERGQTNLQLYTQHRRQPLHRQLLGRLSWSCAVTAIILVHSELLRRRKARQTFLECLHRWSSREAEGNSGRVIRIGLRLCLQAQIEREVHHRVESRGDVEATGAGNVALELPIEGAMDYAGAFLRGGW